MIFGNTKLRFAVNFKALLVLVWGGIQIFCGIKTQRGGKMDDRGKYTNLLCFLPPRFSIFCGWQQGQSPGNTILSLKWLSIL